MKKNKTKRARHTNTINIEKTENLELVSKINKKKNQYFDTIKLDELKSIDNGIFNRLSNDCINSLTVTNFDLLAKANKIQYLPNSFFNQIRGTKLNKLSNDFYNEIQENQIDKIEDRVLKKLIEFEKFKFFNDKSLKCFCHKLTFSDLKEENIVSIIKELNDREKEKDKNKQKVDYDYILGGNFVYLGDLIKSNKLDNYLNYLKKCNYIDDKNQLEIFFNKNKNESILEEDDIKDEDEIIINYNEISYKIDNYLSFDNFDLLQTYCIKCCSNVRNKDKMLNVLNSYLQYSKNNVYDLIDELEIRKILIFISKEKHTNDIHFKRMKEIIKEIQMIELNEPDELMTKVNKFSEIINEDAFDIDFLEILAEENYKNIKIILNKYYNGTDKNAAPPELKKKYVQIIGDYMTIIEKKYKVKRSKIIDGLKKINGDNINQLLILFENSLDKYEKLYYELLVEVILEQPNSESWIESFATPIFKTIRDILIAIGTIKIASLTGSTILTSLIASINGIKIFKDVKDEIVKAYFRLKEEERRIYHLNEKNTPKSSFYLLKKKIKEKYKKIISPIKKYSIKLFNKKIMHLKKKENNGFERNYNFEVKENECEIYKNKIIKKYFKEIKQIIKFKYQQKLLFLKKKFESKNRSTQPKEINKFFEIKKKIIDKEIEIKIKEVKERYPEFKDPSFFKSILNNIGSFSFGLFKSLSNVLTYGLANEFFKKKTKIEIILEMLNNYKYKEFEKELDEIKKQKEDSNFIILKEDIKFLAKSTTNDNKIFNAMQNNEANEYQERKNNKAFFKVIIHNENRNINENMIINENIVINGNKNQNKNIK